MSAAPDLGALLSQISLSIAWSGTIIRRFWRGNLGLLGKLSMKVLIVGSQGQLGTELMASQPAQCLVQGLDLEELDISDRQAVETLIEQQRPQLIINAAAYTAVDKAESAAEIAYAVNAEGAANLARMAACINAQLISISTDFVFDGRRSEPYPVDHQAHPLSVYGASKLAGEQQILRLNPQALIVRTAWVY